MRERRKEAVRIGLNGVLRRAERERGKVITPKSLVKTLLALSLLNIIGAILTPEAGIEWKAMSSKASRGIVQVNMMLKIISPCVSPNLECNFC